MSTPYDYQLASAQQMLGQDCVMLDADMGTGKTIISLTALKLLKHPKCLVVCPAVAVTNWRYEAEKWGTPSDMLEVISYDKVRQAKTKTSLLTQGFEVLILDEAHYLKNPESKRTQAIYGTDGLATKIRRVWLLSGTFAPNNASEYYPHLRCLFGKDLPAGINSFRQFKEYFCVSVLRKVGSRYIDVIIGNKNVAELRTLLKKTSIKLDSQKVLPELPPLSWSPLALDATFPAQLEQEYTELTAFIQSIEEGSVIPHTSSVMRMRRLIAESKIQPISLFIKDFLQNTKQKLVVFSLHLTPLQTLHHTFNQESVLLTGSVPTEKRGAIVQRFQKDAGTRLFFGQLNTANTAITLTAASRVLFIDQSFIPGENLQAAARCHRIGQHHPVLAQVAMIPQSIDERVSEILLTKNRMLTELEYADHIDA